MLSKVASSIIVWVFGMTRPGIEPRSPWPLANTLTIMSMWEFKFQSSIHFKTNAPWERYEPPYPPSYGLNSTTTVLLEGWIWHSITQEGWYAFKNNKQTWFLSSSSSSSLSRADSIKFPDSVSPSVPKIHHS